MNSQRYNKEELYPFDFTDDDKIEYDVLFEQSKVIFPKLCNDAWLLRMGILAYMRKNKLDPTEPPTEEEIAAIRNKYTKDTIFYTEQE